ncbi:MAG: hypothetical protein ABIN55_02945 [Aeromicrobium sp.]
MLTVAEVRARERIALPTDDDAAQGVIDEMEAWLITLIGPLDGSRTETFLAPPATASLRLRRPTDAVAVAGPDGAITTFDLINGRLVVRATGADYWVGPITVTYTPTDDILVRGVLFGLLEVGSEGGYESETIGSYSYSHPRSDAVSARWALVRRLLPRGSVDSILLRSGFRSPFQAEVVSSDAVA